jgi:hypothetical protein
MLTQFLTRHICRFVSDTSQLHAAQTLAMLFGDYAPDSDHMNNNTMIEYTQLDLHICDLLFRQSALLAYQCLLLICPKDEPFFWVFSISYHHRSQHVEPLVFGLYRMANNYNDAFA